MIENFNLDAVSSTEFGVGREVEGNLEFGIIPVDLAVKSELLSMLRATINAMESTEDGPTPYEPAEKHGGTEYLVVSVGGTMDAAIRTLHDAENLPMDNAVLSEPERISCYFAQFTDDENRRLTAIKRAIQFKGVLKSKLVWIIDDTLEVVEDKVFRLDNDFDVILDAARTHIWRPSTFEFLGRLKQEILNAVPANLQAISADLTFLDISNIEQYASTRVSAARLLASIRSQTLQGIDQHALLAQCNITGVTLENVNGTLTVKAGDELGFLEVLDRRRYCLELVLGQQELFKARSRVKINPG